MEKYELSSLFVAKVRFVGKEGLPVWAVTHFLEKTCLNHMKPTLIQRICELTGNGVNETDLSVVPFSAEIFPTESFSEAHYEKVVQLGGEDGGEEFWNIITKYKRPIVLYQTDNGTIPLYDYNGDDAAKIWSFKEQSPPEGVIRGAAGALIELIYAGEKEARARLTHQNQEIGQTTRNLKDFALASQVIADPRTPLGIRKYAEQQLIVIMRTQAELNKQMGIEGSEVDIET